jgi:shikimate kinase
MKIFLCGIPASGKSSFGSSLAKTDNYLYVDAENEWPDDNLHRAWDAMFTDFSKIDDFVNMAGDQVVFDWGFRVTPSSIGIVIGLKARGYIPVWFECPAEIAKKRYIARDNRSIQAFDDQIANIDSNRGIIKEFINPIIINVLDRDMQKSNQEILDAIIKHQTKKLNQ